MGKTKVLIADAGPRVRKDLRAKLLADRDMEIVGEASDGVKAVTMVEEKVPDVVLIDIHMSDTAGVETTRRIKDRHPSTAVIVLTQNADDALVDEALRAGASGYLLKGASRERLLTTIRAVNQLPPAEDINAKLARLREQMFEYLTDHPQGASLSELEHEFRLAPIQIARLLKDLVDENKAKKRGHLYFTVKSTIPRRA